MPSLFPCRPKCSICGCLFFLLLAGIVIIGYFLFKQVGHQIKWQDVVELLERKGKIKLEQETKKQGKKIEGKIYQKATEYNPEGDFLPDEWDDKVKKRIKERVE